ncbi:hypothetical protein Vadar_015120 [Vaccinium darrowii]|uniref:Uncharacterized protein n=1 Tax=Vaccinium darrowii TaxID=229202 RepID=A0ACB7YEU2_9ERIC|nr:hypothetical protein Vadar_015120 [Vaccinium darrowii]
MIQSFQIWFLTQSCTCYGGVGLDTYEKGKIAFKIGGGVCKREKEIYKAGASFGFGSGILQGQLLGGEEHFSIELNENNQVWKPRVVLVLANDTANGLAARVLHQENPRLGSLVFKTSLFRAVSKVVGRMSF